MRLATTSFVLVATPCILCDLAAATTRTWQGNISTDWHTASNWSGNAVPTANDVVVFDGTAVNHCTFSSNVSVLGMTLTADFTRTVTQSGASTLTIGSSHFSMAGGTFHGGTGMIRCNGGFTLSGGTFRSTSGTLFIFRDFTISRGDFQHNNGIVTLDGWDKSVNVGTARLNHLVFNTGGNSVTTTGTINLDGNFTIQSVNYINGGTIAVAGHVTTLDTNLIGWPGTVIQFNGTGPQVLWSGTGRSGLGLVPSIHVNKPSGMLFLQGPIGIFNHWTHTRGNVVCDNYPLHFVGYDKTITAGTMTYRDVIFNTGGNSITISGTMNVAGNLTIQSVNALPGNTIAVSGNVITLDSSINDYPATILFNGRGDQTLSAGGGYGVVPSISINKPSGKLTIRDTIGVHHNWTHISGSVDAAASVVRFIGFDKTINAPNMVFNHVFIQVGGNSVTVTDSMVVAGDFTIESTSYFQGGTIFVGGNLTSNDTSIHSWRGVTFVMNGNGDQLLTANGSAQFPGNVIINKKRCTGGEVRLGGNITLNQFQQNLTITSGALNIESNTLRVNGSSGKLILDKGGILRLNADATIFTNTFSPELRCGSMVEVIGAAVYGLPPSNAAALNGVASNTGWTLVGSCVSSDAPAPCLGASSTVVRWKEVRF